MDTREFIERMAKIENDIREATENRHVRNSRIVTVIDEERNARMKLEKTVASMAERVDRLLNVMEGAFGRPGMVVQQDSIEHRVYTLETWKTQQKAFIAGVAAVGSLVGGLVVAAAQALWHYIK